MALKPDALYQAVLLDLRPYLPRGPIQLDFFGVDPQSAKAVVYGPESEPSTVAAVCLLKSLFKKYQTSDKTTKEQDDTALRKFLAVNANCASWTYSPNTSGDEELMGSVKELIWHFWNPQGFPLVTNPLCLFDRGRTGPGSSVGSNGEDYYTKMYSSKLTYTSEGLFAFYRHWCNENPQTKQAEATRLEEFGQGECTTYNKLSFVPKDDTTSRSIATEPSLNMYAQLGLGSLLEDRLRSFFGLDLRYQQFWNMEAARVGSLSTHGSECAATIDLSSASDSLSIPMLRWLLPPDFMSMLEKLRSPVGILPDGGSVTYNMISTMGNGYTFPLQTMLFASIVVAAIKSFGLNPLRPNKLWRYGPRDYRESAHRDVASWGVFGDDIICHPKVVRRVLRLLQLFGFTVNSDKSFVEGFFRESCGRDYYRGHDVRGVFIKKALDSRKSLIVAINSLVSWSYRTGIELPVTGKALMDALRRVERGRKPLFVPLDESIDAGIRVPLSLLREAGVYPKSNANRSLVYKRLTAAPKELRIGDGFIHSPRGTKKRFYNAAGLLTAFLRGYVRSGRVSIRQSDTRYRTKGCVTPNWDYVPPVSDLLREAGDRINLPLLEIVARTVLKSGLTR